MKRLILIFSVIIISLQSSISQDGETYFNYLQEYPGYREVTDNFFQNYNFPEYKDNEFYRFRFARMPGKWLVFVDNFDGSDIYSKDSVVIWRAGQGFQQSNGLSIDPAIIKDEKEKVLVNKILYNFSIHPFYAYEGWSYDVINFYKNIKPSALTEEELYGTGRAFSEAASSLLWPHFEYSSNNAGKTEADRKTIRKYLELTDEAIQRFELLMKRNHMFSTIVGNIEMKYHNEIVSKWYELKIFGFDRQAKKFLNDHKNKELYSTFWIEYAKDVLNETEDNAILFTNGDNDTYPLLFVQEVMGFRQDVNIINISLLNDPKYYEFITKNMLFGNQISYSISLEYFTGITTKQIIHLLPGNKEKLSDFMYAEQDIVNAIKNNDELQVLKSKYYITFPGGHFLSDTIRFNTTKTFYIRPDQFIFMSLVRNNIQYKPVYFSYGMNPDITGLVSKENKISKGLVYKIQGRLLTINDADLRARSGFYIDFKSIREIYTKKNYPVPSPACPAQQRVVATYLDKHAYYLTQIKEYENTATPDSVIDSFFHAFPPEIYGMNYSYFNILYNYQERLSRRQTEKYSKILLKKIKDINAKTKIADNKLYDISNLEQLLYWSRLLMNLIPEESPVKKEINDLYLDILSKTGQRAQIEIL